MVPLITNVVTHLHQLIHPGSGESTKGDGLRTEPLTLVFCHMIMLLFSGSFKMCSAKTTQVNPSIVILQVWTPEGRVIKG